MCGGEIMRGSSLVTHARKPDTTMQTQLCNNRRTMQLGKTSQPGKQGRLYSTYLGTEDFCPVTV